MAQVDVPAPLDVACADEESAEGCLETVIQNRTHVHGVVSGRVAGRQRDVLAVEQIDCLAGEVFHTSVEVASEELEVHSGIERVR